MAGSSKTDRALMRRLAERLVFDEAYQANLLLRMRTGDLPPQVELYFWQQIFGKPVERIEVSAEHSRELMALSDEELAQSLKEVEEQLVALRQRAKDEEPEQPKTDIFSSVH